jgi:hypothetical protein
VKTLLILLLLPVAAASQVPIVVKPVISGDYLSLINDSSHARTFFFDTTKRAKNTFLLLDKQYYGFSIRKIGIKKGYLNIQRSYPKTLSITGTYNSTVELKTINKLPDLQDQYVQGRSLNGNLVWRGAETNELFSYGPVIKTLEFDGSNYLYDINGRLVTLGSGNGQNAKSYSNDIFRTANLFSNFLTVQGRYQAKENQYLARIKLGQSNENTFIKDNRNAAQNFSGFFEATVKSYILSASYGTNKEKFSNSDRNGFLSRVYQNSILTPISFDNGQGYTIGTMQRRYSNEADNPYFLLAQNENSFNQVHKTGNLVLEKKLNKIKFKVAQSIDKVRENSNEGYAPGTAFFPNGIFTNRIKRDAHYILNVNGSIETRYGGSAFRSTIMTNYIYGNANSSIDYQTYLYRYQRSTNDLEITYLTTYDEGYDISAGLRLSNKFYTSNTSLKNDFVLPGVSAYITFNDLFYANGLMLKLVSNLNNFNSELPISTSYAQNGLTRLSAAQAFQYFPVTEVSSFENVFPIRHKEWTARAELNYKYKLSFQAEFFNRKITDDIFPVYNNGSFELKNIADHRNTGVELILSFNSYAKDITTTNSLSFFTYKDIVSDVQDGYNFTPIAGFSNINKAIVKDEPLGVITGNKFLRDENNKMIIGSHGFPLVDPNLSVIGDPTPDFVMKMSNGFSWKKFSLNLDWEWRKGGDVWNGTQAVLDYYGRSAPTAQLRNTTGYVFNGVLEDGHTNNNPVDFYDPNLPLEENRWVRYGHTGVAEEYIQKGDHIRINNLGVNYKLSFKKYIQTVSISVYTSNLVIWKAYKGTDPNQLLHDQASANGLDFFNLPSVKSFGFTASIQF